MADPEPPRAAVSPPAEDAPPAERHAPAAKSAAAADLVAPEAAAAAAMAMGNLMRTLAVDRRPKVWSDGPTLEDLVRVTLRPLLKEWLDENLPPLVERLVRVEIERVVGRVIP
jgi:cell pole-organizing protein PopZ